MGKPTVIALTVLAAALVPAGAPSAAASATGLGFRSGPPDRSVIRNPAPTFRFTGGDPDGTLRCRIDRRPPFSCESPLRLPRQRDGRHRLSVVELVAGEATGQRIRTGFRVDTVPPDTRFRRAPKRRVVTIARRFRAIFRFRGRLGASRFECRIERRRWRPCRSPVQVRAWPGRHRFAVRAVDRAGNRDPGPAIRRWTVRRWEPGVRAARRYLRRRAGPVSFSVDLGWRRQGFRQGHRARSASTVKTLLMAAYLRRRSVRHRRLTGGERGLLGAMIRHSDNGAASTVRNLDGARAIRRTARAGGMTAFGYSPIWGTCRVSAGDYARFMRRLPGILPRRHRRFALRQLASITPSQRWGIARVRTRGWRLYFKGGWGISDGGHGGVVSHQMGLLRRGRLRIGIAILTEGNPSVGYGNETLRGVARRLLRRLPPRPSAD